MMDVLEKIASDIDRVGWSAIGVLPTEEDMTTNGGSKVPFCYTIGLTELDHPELIIYGMSSDQMHDLLWAAYSAIKDGHHFHPLEHTDKLCKPPFKFVMMPVPGKGRPANMARAYYGEPIDLLQAVWPDDNGNYPWDPEWIYEKDRQPVLYHEPDHPDLQDWEDEDEYP